MSRRPQRPSIERSIHFYRVDIGLDERDHPREFDARPALQMLARLLFTEDGRYLPIEDGGLLCCWPERLAASQRLLLGNVRRNALPLLERAGRLVPLGIPPTSGIVEQTHIVFFDHNIAGVEFNFYGPRVNRLSSYFAAKTPQLYPMPPSFEPLLRQDVRTRLANLEHIKIFDLSIRRGYAGVLAQANRDLFSGLRATAEAARADEIEVILKPRRYSRRDMLSDALLAPIRRLAGRDDLRENASRFQVTGVIRGTDGVELIDVLSDQLIARKRIVRQGPRTRAVDSAAAFAAIEEAHGELRDELLAAARF